MRQLALLMFMACARPTPLVGDVGVTTDPIVKAEADVIAAEHELARAARSSSTPGALLSAEGEVAGVFCVFFTKA